jgi:hypothetical protein
VLPEGVYHWTATHPGWEGPVSAYAIDDGERTVEQVATGLRPLLDKRVEIVLPTHGEPADRAALERALA